MVDQHHLRINLGDPPSDAESAFSVTAFQHVFELYGTLLEEGFTPVECADYMAVAIAGYSPYEWANTRGVKPETINQRVYEMTLALDTLVVFGQETEMGRASLEHRGGDR